MSVGSNPTSDKPFYRFTVQPCFTFGYLQQLKEEVMKPVAAISRLPYELFLSILVL
jgi:hypothetical protein